MIVVVGSTVSCRLFLEAMLQSVGVSMEGNVRKEERIGNPSLCSSGYKVLLALYLCLSSLNCEQTPLSIRVDQVQTTMTDYSITHHLYTAPSKLGAVVKAEFLSPFHSQCAVAMSLSRAHCLLSTDCSCNQDGITCGRCAKSLTCGWLAFLNVGRFVDHHWPKARIVRRLPDL